MCRARKSLPAEAKNKKPELLDKLGTEVLQNVCKLARKLLTSSKWSLTVVNRDGIERGKVE
jgi:hypothetical protein